MGDAGVRDARARDPERELVDREPASSAPFRGRADGEDTEPPGDVEGGEAGGGGETREPARRPTPPLKRALDVIGALAGLAATAPAWGVLAALIKLEDGGPVLYAQERVGKGGERFTSWKFRSMRPRPERDGPPAQAERERERITRVGAFMRPRALDEIPQLLNVLRGEMSLVGPRALLPEEVEHRSEDGDPVRLEELPGYEERHSVLPGLTGLAQTRAARDVPHRRKFHYDVLYARNRSPWLDLRLIVRSVGISLLGGWPEIERDRRERGSSFPDEAESPA